MRLVLLFAVTAMLYGCAGKPPLDGSGEFAPSTELTVYNALDKAQAKTDQSRSILTAYDRFRVGVEPLEQERKSILQNWRTLDRTAPQFDTRARQLAARWAAMAQRQIVLAATFDRAVASTLTQQQWLAWQKSIEDSRRARYQRTPAGIKDSDTPGRHRRGGGDTDGD
ncbi:MAG: hypothetical protein KGJ55_02040 [Gammaproteobacteria bacterium]|nr:hypothetical protein [Gammaproteobacteria bacterium]